MNDRPQLNELGFYVLAGAPKSPAELLDEVPAGEALGLGSAFISERFNIKEAVTLSGRGRRHVAHAGHRDGRDEPQHPPPCRDRVVRHDDAPPDRRAVHARARSRDRDDVRRLRASRGSPPRRSRTSSAWCAASSAVRSIFGHDGPAGSFPVLTLDSSFDEDIPIGFVAFGPNSLALAGRVMDMVVLHTFFTDETTERCVRTVREAAEKAGRDPSSVRIWSVLRDRPRRSARGPAAEEDGGPARLVPAGLRRPVGADERLGPGRAGAVPQRPGGGVVPRRASTTRPTPRPSSTSPRCCPTSGWSRRPPARRNTAPSACCASSTSVSTA